MTVTSWLQSRKPIDTVIVVGLSIVLLFVGFKLIGQGKGRALLGWFLLAIVGINVLAGAGYFQAYLNQAQAWTKKHFVGSEAG